MFNADPTPFEDGSQTPIIRWMVFPNGKEVDGTPSLNIVCEIGVPFAHLLNRMSPSFFATIDANASVTAPC